MLAAALLGALLLAGVHYGREALATTAALAAPVDPPALTASFHALEMRARPFSEHDRAFIDALHRDFATRVRDPRAQVRMLERLAAHLASHHPRAEPAFTVRLLEAAFPTQAAELYHQSRKLVRYRAWLATHRDTLRTLPIEQRRARLWQARRQVFGDSAEMIWAAELRQRVPIGSAMAAP